MKISLVRNALNDVLNHKISVQKELDTLNLEFEEKVSEIEDLELQIKLANEKYNLEKTEVGNSLVDFGKQIEDLERKNQNLKVETQTLKQQSTQRLYKATRRYKYS